MQMEDPATRNTQAERFAHYLEKTYKKTASLMARPCEAVSFSRFTPNRCPCLFCNQAMNLIFWLHQVAVLAGLSPQMQETAFQFGRNLGMAFQLVDDLLDFQADASQLGKPAANDLRSGIATAPVLFAAEEVWTFANLQLLISSIVLVRPLRDGFKPPFLSLPRVNSWV
jgi:decaprenyl-diphosphate synthase subunit 1